MTTIVNSDARFAYTQISGASDRLSDSVRNLVSGKRTNAGVADLSVGKILETRAAVLKIAIDNAVQAKALVSTALGAVDTIIDLVQVQKERATTAASVTLSDNERGFLDLEVQKIVDEIDRIAESTNFNGINLIDGTISGTSGLTTATGLTTENYSLINAGQYSAAGTVATGDLTTTVSKRGENTLTFKTVTAGGSDSITINDTLGIFGQVEAGTELAETISFTSVTGESGAATAAKFVAAAKASTGILARQFDYIDNLDGTVRVVARQYGSEVQGFELSAVIAGTQTIDLGNNGTQSSIEAAAGSGLAFSTNQDSNSAGVDGTFRTIQSANVVKTASSATLTVANATAGATGAITISIGGVAVATTETLAVGTAAETVADSIASALNASTSDYARRFTFSVSGAVVTITNNELGPNTINDALTFAIADAGVTTTTYTLNGTDINGSNAIFEGANGGGSSFTRGTVRDTTVSDTEQTFDPTLQGAITGLTANYITGVGGANNTVQFSATVGGKTYTSQVVNLYSSTLGSGTSSDTILANTVLTFTNKDGDRETGSNEYTDGGFELRLGSSAVTTITNQTTANTFADALQTQLASVTINQNRGVNLSQISASTSDHRITSAVGTILDGLRGVDSVGADQTAYKEGDVRFNTDVYSTTGTQGSVGAFTVSRLTDTIKTTINGVNYTAYLNSSTAPTTGGVQAFGTDADGGNNNGSYNSTTKIIDLTASTNTGRSAKFIFFSDATTDGKSLTIDLGNVSLNTSQIDISTTEGEAALKNALDGALGVSANDSLSLQVGNKSTDTITFSIDGARTQDIYLNSEGVLQEVDVRTATTAAASGDIFDLAFNKLIATRSKLQATDTSIDSSIQNNQIAQGNAEEASSNLLDADVAEDTTEAAKEEVLIDVGTASLANINSRVANILRLLQ